MLLSVRRENLTVGSLYAGRELAVERPERL